MTTTANLGLTLMQAGQLQPDVTFNEDMAILDVVAGGAAQFANNAGTTTGLTYGYFGGRIYSNGANITIANGTIALTASATNYVQRTAAGVISVNTTGYTAGLIPMATVVTGTESITTITDTRPATSDLRGAQSVAVAATNITLTDAQVNCRILRFTGTLTANVVVTLPAYQQEWVMSNETTGAFTLQVQTASGSPVTLAQGASSVIYGNGTILAPASSASSGGSSGSATVTVGTGITLTPTQAANAIIRAQGALTANAAITFPAALVQVWEISNETTGAYTLTALVSGSAATPITIAQGFTATVWSDGANLHVTSPAGAAGGDLTGSYPSPSLAPSGVSAGTYQNPQITFDAKGRATAASNIGGVVATLPASPLVSGTVYQNTGSLPLLIIQPVTYNPTGTVAATCAIALGPTSTPPTIDTEVRPGASTAGAVHACPLSVPPGWYYSYTTTKATLGTAQAFTGSTAYYGIGPSDFAQNPATTTGLTFGYMAGRVRYGSSILSIAASTIALTASATNYIEISSGGTVAANTTGFTSGYLPLFVVVTGTASITSVTDDRAFLSIPASGVFANATVQNYSEVVNAIGTASTSTLAVDMTAGNIQTLTLGASLTLSVTNAAASGKSSNLTLYIYQDATGSRIITWPTLMTGTTAPTALKTAAGALNVVTMETIDGGTSWMIKVIE